MTRRTLSATRMKTNLQLMSQPIRMLNRVTLFGVLIINQYRLLPSGPSWIHLRRVW
jgi:hypothetical protein